jgi:hypothetical protein
VLAHGDEAALGGSEGFFEDDRQDVVAAPVRAGPRRAAPELLLVQADHRVREFCTPVEQITGRKVRSFISGIDTEADGLSTELFVLHPTGYDGPSRIDRAEP